MCMEIVSVLPTTNNSENLEKSVRAIIGVVNVVSVKGIDARNLTYVIGVKAPDPRVRRLRLHNRQQSVSIFGKTSGSREVGRTQHGARSQRVLSRHRDKIVRL
ncbi:hypothetical protein Nepgr_024651 [Nepenthes gracilis]|uniref:Uncharacterized protein n=1 Tax=Nepenthes gracilis TaxID=150966 RepID=A0AAD3T4J5_NEPGR|nr:hypothetical protein Nepgr_024651 [Nepenthes gracilis]